MVFTKFFYSHFMDEHVQNHHKTMGTPADQNTARKDEGLWSFILREMYHSQINSWKREFRRIRTKYGDDVSYITLIILNKQTHFYILHVAIVASIYHFLGWGSIKLQMLHTFWGLYFLDGGNYIEHYGLLRKKDKNGIYEPINKYHSWNHVGNTMWFKL